MKPCHIVLIVTVLTVGILSVGPNIRAMEPPDGDTNGKPIDEPFAPDVGASINLPPFQARMRI